MSWYPSGLPPSINALVRAIDKRFQPVNPNGPVPAKAYSAIELAKIVPTDFVTAINTTSGKHVHSVQSGGVFVWVNADGTAI